jgi:hypothetical protein
LYDGIVRLLLSEGNAQKTSKIFEASFLCLSTHPVDAPPYRSPPKQIVVVMEAMALADLP